jgi:hypothetical protein
MLALPRTLMVTIVGRGTALFTADFWSLDFTSALIPINPLLNQLLRISLGEKKRKKGIFLLTKEQQLTESGQKDDGE